MQDKLVSVRCQAQVAQQLKLFLRVFIHRLFKETIAIAAQGLGVIHRRIGILEEVVPPVFPAGVECDADADGYAKLVTCKIDWILQDVDQFLGETCGIRRIGGPSQHHELISAEPSECVTGPNFCPDAIADLNQKEVSDMMTKGIVDLFEA